MGTEVLAGLIVAAIVTAATLVRYRWVNRLIVKRIVREDDLDLNAALELYEQRLVANVRDRSDDIQRWLREAREELDFDPERLTVFLYAAKVRHTVCAFFYSEYYHGPKLLLISYLVARRSRAGKRGVEKIAAEVAAELKALGCEAIVFELEQPTSSAKTDWLARWRRFEEIFRPSGMKIVRLDVPYVQPRLSLWDEGLKEEPQFLFLGKLHPPFSTTDIPKALAVKVLETVYNRWYAASYDDDSESGIEYRTYVWRLCERITNSLPDPVPISTRPLPRQLPTG